MLFKKIILKNFRNYTYRDFALAHPFVFVEGQNGSGKTNLLEAISLFFDSKGMKKAKMEDILPFNSTETEFVLFSEFCDFNTLAIKGVGSKKEYKFNSKAITSQKAIEKMYHIAWVGPQNDRLFIEAPEKRRTFFEAFLPETYTTLKKEYEHLIKERAKALENNAQNDWILALESQITEKGFELFAQKRQFLEKLNVSLQRLKYLLPIYVRTIGEFSEAFDEGNLTKEYYEMKLLSTRERDRILGGCGFGPHRDDYAGYACDDAKKTKMFSNGYQCLSIISVFLGAILSNPLPDNFVFLIDEILTHLDYDNRVLLFQELEHILGQIKNWQVWVTVTDRSVIPQSVEHFDLLVI